METIRPIPEGVHSLLRSGTVLFDLTRVVEELVYNSLDAGATKVIVYVGIRTCYVKVVDNGFGITRDGLMLLGEKYATSKMKSLVDMDYVSSFGFRGEALGSVSDVSVLEIITKTHGMPNGYRKIIKGCKCLYFGVDDSRQDIGTTVTVRDLYYNQPVRKKQMQNGPRKVFHSVKKCVLGIALMHPKVSFTVIDVESEEELFSTQPSTSPLPLLIKEFGAEACQDLDEFSTTDGISQLYGYISGPQDTYSQKALQFTYINLRYVGKCLIHKLLNELASRFAFQGDSATVSKRNRAQLHPSFILNLTCPRSFYDLSFEPSHTTVEFKDWSSLLTFIEREILKFWNTKHSGDILRSVAALKEVDPLIPFEEDLSMQFHALDDACSKKNVKTSSKYLTDTRQKQDSKSNCIPPFQSQMITNDIDDQNCVRGFACGMMFPAWGCDEMTNWSKSCSNEDQCPDDEMSYLEDECQLYESGFTARERNSARDYHSRIDEDLFQNTPKKSREIILCDGYKLKDDIGNFSFSPILQSCSRRESTSFGRFSCANDNKDDIFTRQRNQDSLFDGADATKEECYKKFEFSSASRKIDLIADAYSCSPDTLYSRFESQGQYLDYEDTVDGTTDDCYQINNYISGTEWQVDPLCDLPRQPRKRMRSLDRNYITQLSDEGDHGHYARNFGLSQGDRAGIGLDNFSFGTETLNSIYQDTFGCSIEHEAKDDKGEYIDDLLYEEMKDVSVDLDIDDECSDASPGFDNFKYLNKFAPKYTVKNYEDDYWFTEDNNLLASDANACQNSCYIDTVKPFKVIPSSIGYEESRVECRANVCSLQGKLRSQSAPPFFRSRKKFMALSDYTSKEKHTDSKSVRASVTEEVQVSEQLPHYSGASRQHVKPNSVKNLFNARSPLKIEPGRGLDIPEITKDKTKPSLDCFQFSSVDDQRPKESQMPLDAGTKWRDCSLISAVEQSGNSHHEKNHHDQMRILDVASGILQYSADLLVPEYIDKECLMDAKVLQQVDKKYIPIVGRGVLAVIDQHAADERIRLEELRHKVLSGELKKTSYLDHVQVMELPEVCQQLLHKYATQIESWGWICKVHAQALDSFTKNMSILHSSSAKAVLLSVPCILGVVLSDVDLLEYLHQLADTDGSSTIPPAILRILNSKACRGAIMFGDALLPSECSLLVEELKNTSLCFQCAHGRPTMVPLVNLRVLHKRIAKLPTSNGESCDSWHGLCRHQISLDSIARQLHPGKC